MPEQDLTIRHKSEGADKVAADLGKIDKAQDTVQSTTKAGTKTTEAATDAQGKLNAAEGDFFSLLSQIDPRLGLAADQLMKFAKITAGATTDQKGLGAAVSKTTQFLKDNAQIVKLIGAATAAAAAIYMLVQAYKALAEERERANKALAAENEALEESRKQHRDEAAAIREAADARKNMPELTVEASTAAAREAKRLTERFPGIKPEEAQQIAVGYAGTDVSAADREAAALALSRGQTGVVPEPWMGPEAREAHLQDALSQDRVRQAEAAARRESAELARRQAQRTARQAQQGAGEDIEALIRRESAGLSDEGMQKYLEVIKHVGGTPGGLEDALGGRDRARRHQQREFGTAYLQSQLGAGDTGFIRDTFNLDKRELNEITRVLMRIEQNTWNTQPTVGMMIINGEDAASRAGKEIYGANMRDGREGR